MIIFAGGGSGGHIIPALAIAEEMGLGKSERLVFVCSDRKLDSELLTREGVEFRVVPAKPVALRPRGLWRFLRSWGPSVRAGRALIREGKKSGRVVVVATGGFVAAPIARAARVEGVPVVLVNLDAVPGKANRLVARRADVLYSAAPVVGPSAGLPWRIVPPIVRRSAMATNPAGENRARFGLEPGVKTLLVTGGSQGAVSVNRVVMRAVKERRGAFDGWQVIHQCGRGEEEAVEAVYRESGVRCVVRAFFERMGEAWTAADLAVSRAGAGGVAEAWAYGVPTLFLPNPYHTDEHQRLNAMRLVEAGGAVVVKDRVEAGLNTEAVEALVGLMGDSEKRGKMKERLRGLGPADGAGRVADGVREVLA